MEHPADLSPAPVRGFPWLAVAVVTVACFGCSIYANLSFAVEKREDLVYFPPYKKFVDNNNNRHLGAEYFNIARSLYDGEGFSNPFPDKTGPTAWMPPLLPAIEAGLLWATGGDKDAVMAVVVFMQVYTLILTGVLVLVLARQTTSRLWTWVVAFLFIGALVTEFHLCFQVTHDCWFIMLGLDLIVAGFCWLRPLNRWAVAGAWGFFGGMCALINPILAMIWGVLTVGIALRERAWRRFGVACAVAGLTLMPWTVRNYMVFGKLIPVKSNLAYELYQSQCLQPDGLIQSTTWSHHPYGGGRRERQEYKSMGEIAYVERKREQFWQAVAADPLEFVDRVACRFLGATLWYVPMERAQAAKRPVLLWINRAIHPLPFVAFLVLVGMAPWVTLGRAQWFVMGIYALYLMPYVGASYYERYAIPLLGVKVLLVVWAVDRLLPWRSRERVTAEAQELALRSAVPSRPHQVVPSST